MPDTFCTPIFNLQKLWRNKPLFRREGDARFRTGNEAASMLVDEVGNYFHNVTARLRRRLGPNL
jgi:hypothetical protein